MPFVAIKGSFHVVNYSPDGDSIRFAPNDLALLSRLSGGHAKVNARGHVQLRIEAIDALETHYTPPSGGGVYHQPLRWADAAADRLLQFAGIDGVEWDASRKTVVAAKDGTPGYILCRAVEKYGRPIAFVFAGAPPEHDGATVKLAPARLKDSYNHAALAEGLVFPTYYKGLFADLRAALTALVEAARAKQIGLWADDVTNTGVDVTGLAVLTQDAVILPKLFRRLSEYLANTGAVAGFKDRLAQAPERVLDLTDQNFTHLDTFVEQHGDRIALTRKPEQLVFDEMAQQPGHPFSLLMEQLAPSAAAQRGTRPAG